MQELIKLLEQPRTDSEGKPIGPSNLNRRAADAIKQLLQIIANHDLNLQTLRKDIVSLQEELNGLKNNNSSGSSSSSTSTT